MGKQKGQQTYGKKKAPEKQNSAGVQETFSDSFDKPAEKQYDFISEDVMPTPKDMVGRSKSRLVALVLCLAVFFGILASISYAVSNGVLEYIAKKNNEAERTPIQLGGGSVDSDQTEHAIITDISVLAETVEGAVVQVYTVTETGDGLFSDTLTSKEDYYGIVIADDGQNFYVLSDYDVLASSKSLVLKFGDVTTEGRIVGFNSTLNIAVIVVKYADYYMEDFSGVKILEFAAPGSVERGSAVMAVGAPNGIVGSIDYGIITSGNNFYPVSDLNVNVFTSNLHYYKDAAGVVVNMEGKICGILSDIYAEKAITSFVSTDNMTALIEYLANNSALLYTGAVCEDVTGEILRKAGCSNGIYVQKVESGSPADEAGLRSGDIITHFGDEPLYSVDEYTKCVYDAGYDGKISIRVKRNGTDKVITLTVAK
ncbi:MAG: S1C family serine protease [Lachnospiraceae bacterium]